MKVVLHDPYTDLYLVDTNMWTNDRSKAHNFQRMEEAIDLALRNGLDALEVVIAIKRAPADIHVPVGRSQNNAQSLPTNL